VGRRTSSSPTPVATGPERSGSPGSWRPKVTPSWSGRGTSPRARLGPRDVPGHQQGRVGSGGAVGRLPRIRPREADWRGRLRQGPGRERGLLLPVRISEIDPPGLLTTRIWRVSRLTGPVTPQGPLSTRLSSVVLTLDWPSLLILERDYPPLEPATDLPGIPGSSALRRIRNPVAGPSPLPSQPPSDSVGWAWLRGPVQVAWLEGVGVGVANRPVNHAHTGILRL
jgi:hypothetical protein